MKEFHTFYVLAQFSLDNLDFFSTSPLFFWQSRAPMFMRTVLEAIGIISHFSK